MVNFKKLTDKAKDVVEKRGGTDSLKEDANQLKDIAKGKGSLKDKATAAKDALKEPAEERRKPNQGAAGGHPAVDEEARRPER